MQMMKGLVKYHLQQYFKTNKLVMPFTAFMIMLYSNYSIKPADFIGCLLVCVMFVFLIMVWVGVTVCDLDDMVSEQILILRIQSKRNYYISHILFLLLLSFAIALITIAYPLVLNFVYRGNFFEQSLLISDGLGAFLILFLSAFAGCAVGELSHPRMIKDRKVSVLFIFIVAVLSLVKGEIIAKFPLLKLILWVLPPIWEVSYVISNKEGLFVYRAIAASSVLLISSIFLTVIKIKLLVKRGF